MKERQLAKKERKTASKQMRKKKELNKYVFQYFSLLLFFAFKTPVLLKKRFALYFSQNFGLTKTRLTFPFSVS